MNMPYLVVAEILTETLEYVGYPDAARVAARMAAEVHEARKWESAEQPCSGPGYAHKAHGKCPGYGTDRT